ncbi:hypothetical protein [Alicyclobacillus acidiphilus]|nr:hypothetical protein [Alicyclobacillus acidiphilus]
MANSARIGEFELFLDWMYSPQDRHMRGFAHSLQLVAPRLG